MSTGAGRFGSTSATAVAARPPIAIWPSPPMLNDVRAERDADADADEQERDGLDGGAAERVAAAEGSGDERVVAVDRVRSERGDHHGADEQCRERRGGQCEPAQQQATPLHSHRPSVAWRLSASIRVCPGCRRANYGRGWRPEWAAPSTATAYVVTMDDAGTEHDGGWLLVADGLDRGRSGAGRRPEADETVDLAGALVTPGLVNTHHHLYQTLTRARAQEATLFEWLTELYPVWAGIDAEAEYAAARTGLAELALSGCTTVFDHHYVFPRGEERARRGRGARGRGARRAHRRLARLDGPRRVRRRPAAGLARRGDRRDPRRHGAARRAARRRRGADRRRTVLAVLGHRPADGGVGGAGARDRASSCTPTSPRRSTRRTYCQRAVRLPPGRVPRLARLARRRRLVRALRPPLAAGRRALRADRLRRRALPDLEPPARRRRRAACASCSTRASSVGLGVDGSASNERSDLFFEVKQALLVARGRGGPAALTAREALRLGTRGGAAVLRRQRHRLARAGQARRLRRLAHGRARVRRRRRPGRGARASPARTASTASSSAATTSSREGRLVRADEDGDRAGAPRAGAEVRGMSREVDLAGGSPWPRRRAGRPRHPRRRASSRSSRGSGSTATSRSSTASSPASATTRASETLDASGRYVVPGFIDAHMHIESSKLMVDEFARLVLPARDDRGRRRPARDRERARHRRRALAARRVRRAAARRLLHGAVVRARRRRSSRRGARSRPATSRGCCGAAACSGSPR